MAVISVNFASTVLTFYMI